MRARTVFIVWNVYQRRAEALCGPLEAEPLFFHFRWEDRSPLHKLLAYMGKTVKTLAVLRRARPSLFYVQAPPIFAVYVAWLYSRMTRTRYVVDAHDSMIYGSRWPRMPFARAVLNRAAIVWVHHRHVAHLADVWGLRHRILMDRPLNVEPGRYSFPASILRDRRRARIVVPCSYGRDEPLLEMQQATLRLPEVDFYLTHSGRRLPTAYRGAFGPNVCFTGFLATESFNALLAHADAILVLTTRENTQPSGASEALAFRKPLIVSDLPIVRELFPAGAIYVRNEADSIAAGIRTALARKDALVAEMTAFLPEKLRRWEAQWTAAREASGVPRGNDRARERRARGPG